MPSRLCACSRIEAACLPHNAVSIQLLERVGFKREGPGTRLSAPSTALARPSPLCAPRNRPAALASACGATVAEWRKMSLASRVWNLVRRYPALLVLALLLLEVAPGSRHRIRAHSARTRQRLISRKLLNAMALRVTSVGLDRAGSDGIVRRIEVRALEPGSHPNWIVFRADQ